MRLFSHTGFIVKDKKNLIILGGYSKGQQMVQPNIEINEKIFE